jgi:hypothetical protein
MPVTAADMEAFLNLATGQDTDLLEAFIEASYDAIRQYLHRSIVTETLELRMDGFPGSDMSRELSLGSGVHVVSIPWVEGAGSYIDLPFGPVSDVNSITVFALDNTSSVFSDTQYEFDASRIYLNEGATWPTDLRRRDAVAIEYVSGFNPVPPAIIQAIKQHVAVMYECREGCEMPAACKAMLQPYRRLDQLGF